MVVNPEEHTDVIVWESSDEDIATVDEYGVVTPIATGKVKISAKAVAGNKTATCTVTVSRMPEGIMFDGEEEIAVAQGKTATLKGYAYYEENDIDVTNNTLNLNLYYNSNSTYPNSQGSSIFSFRLPEQVAHSFTTDSINLALNAITEYEGEEPTKVAECKMAVKDFYAPRY